MSENVRSRAVRSLADLATLYKEAQTSPEFVAAFGETTDTAIYTVHDDPIALDLPEVETAEAACQLIIATLFDVFRDTRVEHYAERAAWGFVHSFHKLAEFVGLDEDRACNEVRKLARRDDSSEIGTSELEKAQLLAQSLTEARTLFEAIGDYAADVFRAETGHTWSPPRGSKVSKLTQSQIDSLDYLAAIRQEKRDRLRPQGPAVIVSGGAWEDVPLLWDTLDDILRRIPHMVLHTTAKNSGTDLVSGEWAAARNVPLVKWRIRGSAKRAGFARNESLSRVKAVEGVITEGSFLQVHLARLLRARGVPLHIYRLADQDLEACRRRTALQAFQSPRQTPEPNPQSLWN